MARIDRLESLFKREIAAVIQKNMDFNKIGLVSILRIDISKDLEHAKVYYSHLGDNKSKEKANELLRKARGFIKGELGKVLHIKSIPSLNFIYDDELQHSSCIADKIKQLNIPPDEQ